MTVIELTNLALLKIGVSKGITALTDASQEAWTAALLYDHTLRAALRAFPWPFATKYADLSLVQGQAWTTTVADILVQAWVSTATYAIGDVVVHSGTIYYAILASLNQPPPNATYWTTTYVEGAHPAEGDWLYSYRWPSDCLFARRMVPAQIGGGRTFSDSPIPFRVGRDVNGLLLYTNESAAVLEYTMIDCDALWANDLWLEAFTWWLGAQMAPSLSQDHKMHEKCLAMFRFTMSLAATVDSREGQLEKPGEAEWIRNR